jgi:TRAP-type C4-dicarboxylate transport system permease small subunit
MRFLNKFEEIYSGLLMIAVAVIAFVQVVVRYVLKIPAPWTEELDRYLMVWLVFIAGAIAVRKKAHLRIELLEELFRSEIASRILNIIVSVLILIFSAVLLIISLQFLRDQLMMGQLSPSMQISMAWVYAALSVGALLFFIHTGMHLYQDIGELYSDMVKK